MLNRIKTQFEIRSECWWPQNGNMDDEMTEQERERERETLTVWLKNYKNVYGTLLSASDSTPTGDSRCILRTKIARAFSKPQSPVWLWTQFPGVGVHRVFIGPLGNKAVFARHWSVATMSTSQEELGWICEVFGKWNSNSGTYFVASKQYVLICFTYIYCCFCINYSAFILINSNVFCIWKLKFFVLHFSGHWPVWRTPPAVRWSSGGACSSFWQGGWCQQCAVTGIRPWVYQSCRGQRCSAPQSCYKHSVQPLIMWIWISVDAEMFLREQCVISFLLVTLMCVTELTLLAAGGSSSWL